MLMPNYEDTDTILICSVDDEVGNSLERVHAPPAGSLGPHSRVFYDDSDDAVVLGQKAFYCLPAEVREIAINDCVKIGFRLRVKAVPHRSFSRRRAIASSPDTSLAVPAAN